MVRISALWLSVGSVRTSNNGELVYVLLAGIATKSYCHPVVEHWSFLSMATRIFVFLGSAVGTLCVCVIHRICFLDLNKIVALKEHYWLNQEVGW